MYNIEFWKPIIGYEGLYEVSNLGRVKSLNYNNTNQEGMLKPSYQSDGYLNITLCKFGKAKRYRIHRLVAEAFIPNPNNYPEVNHIDENKLNNCVENLEWCDRQYNQDYSLSKQVGQYDLNGNLIKVYKSTREAERQTGYLSGVISYCCIGKIRTAYGYIWKYL